MTRTSSRRQSSIGFHNNNIALLMRTISKDDRGGERSIDNVGESAVLNK